MAVQLDTVKDALAGRYEVEGVIGRGGMSIVFRGRPAGEDRPVAIKVLRPEFAVTILGERFHREIGIIATLNHPNILPLIDSDEAGALIYYVMPFATEGSLRPRLEKREPLGLEETLAIIRQVAAGLDYAHAHNVIHRDIKPENVMFEAERAMICDFGVARAVIRAGGERLSSSGMVVGTPAYMSPEQAQGEDELGPSTDIYALGCLVYEMLAGEPPFTGRTAQAIMARHIKERPPSLRVVRPDVPAHVEEAIGRALAKRPKERPGSASEFTTLLLESRP